MTARCARSPDGAMYEHRRQPLLHPAAFLWRLARHVLATLGLIALSLVVGMAGYMHFEKLPAMDAFVNAAMLLGGMGPVSPLTTESGKLFAGCFALYCGLVVIVAAGLLFAPLLHRVLHRLHVDEAGRRR